MRSYGTATARGGAAAGIGRWSGVAGTRSAENGAVRGAARVEDAAAAANVTAGGLALRGVFGPRPPATGNYRLNARLKTERQTERRACRPAIHAGSRSL